MLQLPYFSSQTPAYHPYWLKSAFYYSKIFDVTICHRFRSLNIVKVFWKGLANVALFDYLVWKQETEKLKETLEKEVLKIEVTPIFFSVSRWLLYSQFDKSLVIEFLSNIFRDVRGPVNNQYHLLMSAINQGWKMNWIVLQFQMMGQMFGK